MPIIGEHKLRPITVTRFEHLLGGSLSLGYSLKDAYSLMDA